MRRLGEFIGIVLIATGVPVYVILPAYAILFLLALPLVSLGARALAPLTCSSACRTAHT